MCFFFSPLIFTSCVESESEDKKENSAYFPFLFLEGGFIKKLSPIHHVMLYNAAEKNGETKVKSESESVLETGSRLPKNNIRGI
jgi:hypothetical protein